MKKIFFHIPGPWRHNYLLFFLLWVLLCSGACHKTGTAEETGLMMKEITVDGAVRRYALYVPEHERDTPLPLLLVLHGGGGKIETMVGETGRKSPYKLWMEIADREKFLVIYPQAVDGPTGWPNWNDCRNNAPILPEVNDVKFLTTLMDRTAADYLVDTDRIYVTGISNGGIMTLRLATEIPQRLAAVAPISASLPDSSECQDPATPLPVLFMNGTADPMLPYAGGTIGNPPDSEHGTVLPVETSVRTWCRINHTDTIPQTKEYTDKDPGDGSTVTCYTYSNGVGGTEVVFFKITGGGHAAPSIREQYSQLWQNYVGPQNHDIEMAEEIWNFFRQHQRPSR
jgi:polyhydroxybutyrate depolymerase